jgi:tetratricopeptide (TPR) repeat protein
MRRKARLLGLAVILFLSLQMSAQGLVDKHDQEQKRTVAALETKETLANRKQLIEEVRAMQNRVLRFQDSDLKIRTIILLADMLWGKGRDEEGARLLFMKADDLVRSVRVSKGDDLVSRNDKNTDASAVSPGVLRDLKKLLVRRLSAHELSWSQSLSRAYGLGDGSPSDIASLGSGDVLALIGRGQITSATRYLHEMIDENISGQRSLLNFLSLLFALRAQNAQAADSLFMEATLKMSGQPNVAANDVLIMGNYLFASRFLPVTPRFFGVSQIRLGEVLVQADVAQVRTGNSTVAARSYIGNATLILGRGSDNPEEMKRRAAAAYLLLPHAQAFAPEFASQLSAIQRGPDIDFSLQKTNSLPLAENGKIDLKAVLESVDAIATSKLRDQYVLKTVSTLYSKGDLDAALTVAEKMGDLNGRHQIVSVIIFARAVKSLELGQIEVAQRSLNSVTSSLQRFLLRLGLARLYLKQHDEPAAAALLNDGIKDIRDHGDELEQPYLILSEVKMLASFDRPVATDRLRDAIKAFNVLEPPRKARAGANLFETITVGGSSASFPLQMSLVKFESLGATIKSLSSDPQGVKAILFELKDERILSEGMLGFANALLG